MTLKPLTSVRKFYLLDYFYVLLKSIEKYSDRELIFTLFRDMKQEYQLGESKYKKLTTMNENLTKVQLDKYRYTFEKVISESLEYDLIKQDSNRLTITEQGSFLLSKYHKGHFEEFTLALFKLMEQKYGAFRHMIELLYKANQSRPGLLILPIYSPLQLGLNRKKIITTGDIKNYSRELISKLELDVTKYLGMEKSLLNEDRKLLGELIKDGLIPQNNKEAFNPERYNAIISRFRNYWVQYFLKEIYHYEYFLSSFEIWIYRAKQIGIIHATEFYPGFNGKIIYPTSIIIDSTNSSDFENIFSYPDNKSLYVHKPNFIRNQELFIDQLVKAYFELRKVYRSYFINLSALREMVCLNLKISEFVFASFINEVYQLTLSGEVGIKISLEVDRLPEETRAIYLKQEPVIVDGKYRNIIGIDVSREERKNGH